MKNDHVLDELRRDRAALEAEIRAAGSTIKGDACNCPHPDHEDANPSASIHQSKGVWRVTCWSGSCFGTIDGKPKGADVYDLIALSSGRKVEDVLREEREKHNPKQKRDSKPAIDFAAMAKACYAAMTDDQREALGESLGLSVDALRRMRYGWCAERGVYTVPMFDANRTVIGIRTRTPEGRKFAIEGSRSGLFIPADLSGKGTLIIAEGATDPPAVLDAGHDCVGRPSNTSGEDHIVAYLEKHPRPVAILKNRDPEGSKAKAGTDGASERLAQRLTPIIPSVVIVQPPEPFKDARAWRIAGAGYDDIDALIAGAAPTGPADDLRQMLEEEIAGKRVAVPLPFRALSRGTQALMPGTVTMFGGEGGATKSLLLLWVLAQLHEQGVNVAVFELEDQRAAHLKRALAQRAGVSDLTNLEWVKQHPDEAMRHHERHAAFLDSFGRCIFDAPDAAVSLSDLVRWVRERAESGCRVIAIDPITLADTTDRPWDDEKRFLAAVKPIIDQHGASLVLVTHPRKGRRVGPVTMDDIAGSAAYSRFAQTVLWLEHFDEKEVLIKSAPGGPGDAFPMTLPETINRTVRILKARNGRGTGWALGFRFDVQTLRFAELGIVAKREHGWQARSGDTEAVA